MGNICGSVPQRKAEKQSSRIRRLRTHIDSEADVKTLLATYDIEQEALGSGAFGQVFRATDKMDPEVKVAIKTIDKKKLTPKDIATIKREAQIINNLDHPNVVDFYETYESKRFIYLCMELLETELLSSE